MVVKKNKKGADAGTQFSHWTKNPHEDVKVKKVKVGKGVVNVYKANFSEIDNLIEEIKKESRKQGVSDYACQNIFLALGTSLQSIRDSNK